MKGKFLLLFSSSCIQVLLIFQSTALLGQNVLNNTFFEYGHSYFHLHDFESASKIYNEHLKYSYSPNHELIFPVISNFKMHNDSMYNYWIKQYVVRNYTKDVDYRFLKDFVTKEEYKYLDSQIDSVKSKLLILSNLKFGLYNKIKELIAVDQFIRSYSYIRIQDARSLDSIFVFNTLMDILYQKLEYEYIQDAANDLYVILIHQADISLNFNKILELDYMNTLLLKNIITPFQYAYTMDRYFEKINGETKYGTLYSIGMVSEIDPNDLQIINKERLSIGLCELEFDYRNVKSLISEEELKIKLKEKTTIRN